MGATSSLRCRMVVVVAGLCFAGVASRTALAVPLERYVVGEAAEGGFALASEGRVATVVVEDNADQGVQRAARMLWGDLTRVTGVEPGLTIGDWPVGDEVVVIGTIGRGGLIDELARDAKIDVSDVKGKWETFVTQTVESPWAGVERALVIAGSDKRGTIYGALGLSAQIGVSPWSWWADVPVERRSELHVLPGRHSDGEPAVKYRGIFINDEAPAFSGWAHEKYGGVNSAVYERVFELILRLRGNYLWPAMWGRSLFDDDPKSQSLADEMGIVLGTSHHEPLMRAHVEWSRYGDGPWDYNRNAETLRGFWREGVERMADRESLVTIGMRGDGDEAMSEEADIALLERIVADQREIIEDVTGAPAAETPQVWALYKEVQTYYDRGMRMPDDVTLLLCDDNWGNVRRLPPADTQEREGGYGVYYHFDYVGGPRNYKWINTNPLPRIWEQMTLAYEHGVDRIWIVNVGDIKPMELPIEFFLDLAWDPDAYAVDSIGAYPTRWAAEQFPLEHAAEIGALLRSYAKFNARRKPEMLDAETFGLVDYREWEGVVADWRRLSGRAERVRAELPERFVDAFDQLVWYPVVASANLNELYFAAAKNRLYADQGRASADRYASEARELFERDAALARHYNEVVADGKWRHMMDQTNIGYTYWQQPEADAMPEVSTVDVPTEAGLGVAVEGDERSWPGAGTPTLPTSTPFDDRATSFEVFNRGRRPLGVSIEASEWLSVTAAGSSVGDDEPVHTDRRYEVHVDWDAAPLGRSTGRVSVRGADGVAVTIDVPVWKPRASESIAGFVETNGHVSIPATDYDDATSVGGVGWRTLPDLGRTGSAVGASPVNADRQRAGEGPRLAYRVHLTSVGEVDVHVYCSPTLDYLGDGGLRYAVSFDDEDPVEVNLHADSSGAAWNEWVGNNINVGTSAHVIDEPGGHTLNVWMIDPGVVFQKIVVDTGDMKSSYLGPPPSPNPTRKAVASGDRAVFEWFAYEGRDPVYEKHEAGPGAYTNPIMAGFYPDPSITRVGDDFYMVHSTFCYFPGIPVFHSTDLVNWTQIGSVIDRPGMLEFEGRGLSRGVFAPAIEHHDGVFYVINTCVDCGGNFVVTATDPAGPWSDPVWLPEVDGIDPSIFFDDNGEAWVLNNGGPIGAPKYDGHRAIWIQRFDEEKLETFGPRKLIVDGGADPSTKPIWIEGPHIFKKDGRYYLIAAEGGTSTWHSQVVFRGNAPDGPWEPYKDNPILTQRRLDADRPDPITSAGHADFVRLDDGSWWSVFLATRPYEGNYYNTGRETFLLPVAWNDGWPRLTGAGEVIPYVHERPALPSGETPAVPTSGNFSVRDEFEDDELASYWTFVRAPRRGWHQAGDGELVIESRSASIGELGQPSFVGRRQQHMNATFETAMRYAPERAGDRAGLVALQNDLFYYFFGLTQRDGVTAIELARRSGSDDPVAGQVLVSKVIDTGREAVRLRISARGGLYDFEYAVGDGSWTTLAEDVDGKVLSTQTAGGFVGSLVGMYAERQGDQEQ